MPRRQRPRPPRRRRPGRRPALRRGRLRRRSPRSPRATLGEPLRTFSIGFEEAGFDELSRARLVAERYGTDHHELVAAPRRGRAAAAAGRGLRRALRRLLGAADLPRLPARLRARQGRDVRRGRRRALRRLLHLRRRPPRPPRRPPRARSPGRWPRRCRAATTGSASTTKPSASPAPRRLPPLERHHAWKEIFSPQARAELAGAGRRRLGPARPLPRALRRDRGRRAAGADAGRRPRHLPGRRPAGQDRPRSAWPTRWSCASPSSTRRSPSSPSRCRRAEGARLRRRSGCCARRWRRCCRGRSSTAASRASRSRSPPGCAGRWSRSPARCWRRARSRARACSSPPR